jgi:hypothetical protein
LVIKRDRHGEPRELTVYGCAFRHRPIRLARLVDARYSIGASVGFPVLIGRQVAYVYLPIDTRRTQVNGAPRVRVMNLHTGRLARSVGLPENTWVRDFDAVRPGAVAWVQSELDSPADPGSFRVFKLNNAGRTLLDSGGGIVNGSLAISEGTVYWTSGGLPRSAALARG